MHWFNGFVVHYTPISSHFVALLTLARFARVYICNPRGYAL